MAMHKKCLALLLLFGLMRAAHVCLYSAPAAEPFNSPMVRVTVDPRVELLSLIFRLAGNQEYTPRTGLKTQIFRLANPSYSSNRVEGYMNDVEQHFGPFKSHAVVEQARELRNTRGVSYDAPMSMAVHITDAEKLEEKVPFDPRPDGLDARWPLEETRSFLEAARQFVKESNFQGFLDAHRQLYDKAEDRMRNLLDKEAHLDWFDEFFGARPQANFKVIIGMQNGGNCYGPHCRLPDGKEELYCILGVWKTDKQGLPDFDTSVMETVIHEFCHSYANPIIDRHQADLQAAGKKIFSKVASSMQRQAYGNWKTMMYESLVRACTLRYIHRFGDEKAYQAALREEKQRQFLWIEGLSNLLGEYETQRQRYPTLEDFAPRIVEFFNDYAAKSAE
jgi:hypothetical protein